MHRIHEMQLNGGWDLQTVGCRQCETLKVKVWLAEERLFNGWVLDGYTPVGLKENTKSLKNLQDAYLSSFPQIECYPSITTDQTNNI